MLILSSATIKEKVKASEQIAKLESHGLREAAEEIPALLDKNFTKKLVSAGALKRKLQTELAVTKHATTPDSIANFETVDVLPEFPGGQEGFGKYIQKQYKYTPEAIAKGISGKIIMSFIVEKDGSLTNIKILRDLGLGTGEEALRILEKSPKWKPGKQKGKVVRVNFTIPIGLRLEVEEKKTGNNTKIIYILDEKEITEDEYKAAINAGNIKATHMDLRPNNYGERGKHGVINAYVNTNPPTEVNTNSFYKKAATTLSEIPALIILDGKEISQESFKKMDQSTNKFKSVYILTDVHAINKYGNKGKDGVIEITTKGYTSTINGKPSSEQSEPKVTGYGNNDESQQ
jgi:TonB family protein